VRALAAAAQTLGADELADDDIRAETAAQAPEGRLAHPGLRREIERDRALAEPLEKIAEHAKM